MGKYRGNRLREFNLYNSNNNKYIEVTLYTE